MTISKMKPSSRSANAKIVSYLRIDFIPCHLYRCATSVILSISVSLKVYNLTLTEPYNILDMSMYNPPILSAIDMLFIQLEAKETSIYLF